MSILPVIFFFILYKQVILFLATELSNQERNYSRHITFDLLEGMGKGNPPAGTKLLEANCGLAPCPAPARQPASTPCWERAALDCLLGHTWLGANYLQPSARAASAASQCCPGGSLLLCSPERGIGCC